MHKSSNVYQVYWVSLHDFLLFYVCLFLYLSIYFILYFILSFFFWFVFFVFLFLCFVFVLFCFLFPPPFFSDYFLTCPNVKLNITEGQTETITSPMYPNTPISLFAYQCSWIIQTSTNLAYLIEILHFQGPTWLSLQIIAPDDKGGRYYNDFYSRGAPTSITLGNRAGLFIELKEKVLFPKRLKGDGFLANITALSTMQDGKVHVGPIFIKRWKFSNNFVIRIVLVIVFLCCCCCNCLFASFGILIMSFDNQNATLVYTLLYSTFDLIFSYACTDMTSHRVTTNYMHQNLLTLWCTLLFSGIKWHGLGVISLRIKKSTFSSLNCVR